MINIDKNHEWIKSHSAVHCFADPLLKSVPNELPSHSLSNYAHAWVAPLNKAKPVDEYFNSNKNKQKSFKRNSNASLDHSNKHKCAVKNGGLERPSVVLYHRCEG